MKPWGANFCSLAIAGPRYFGIYVNRLSSPRDPKALLSLKQLSYDASVLFSIPPSGMVTTSNGEVAFAKVGFGVASKLGPKNSRAQLI